jgi:hypothetical protein
MSDSAPTSYAEVIDILERLPLLVREARRRRGLSLRAAARDAGVGFANISRCENGEGMHLSTVVPLLRWVGTPDSPCPHCGSPVVSDQPLDKHLIGTGHDPDFVAHQDHRHPFAGCGFCPEEEDR